jgi:hypothetical protein
MGCFSRFLKKRVKGPPPVRHREVRKSVAVEDEKVAKISKTDQEQIHKAK